MTWSPSARLPCLNKQNASPWLAPMACILVGSDVPIMEHTVRSIGSASASIP